MSYTLINADVRRYLASLASSDEAGVAGDAHNCLIARALAYKYHLAFVAGRHDFCLLTTEDTPSYPYADELVTMPTRFDDIAIGRGSKALAQGDPDPGASITRAEVEAAIVELRG